MTTTYEEKPGVDSTGKGRVVPAGGTWRVPTGIEPALLVGRDPISGDANRPTPIKKDPDPKAGESPAPKGKDDAEQGEGFTDSVTGERITLDVLLRALGV